MKAIIAPMKISLNLSEKETRHIEVTCPQSFKIMTKKESFCFRKRPFGSIKKVPLKRLGPKFEMPPTAWKLSDADAALRALEVS